MRLLLLAFLLLFLGSVNSTPNSKCTENNSHKKYDPEKQYENKPFFIDKCGNVVIELEKKYKILDSFHEGKARIMDKNKNMGFIDKTGKIAIPLEYKKLLFFFSEGFAIVSKHSSCNEENSSTVIDKDNRVVIPESLGYLILGVSEGMAPFIRDVDEQYGEYGWGYISMNGEIIIQPIYEQAIEFHEGLAAVRKNAHWGFIDKSGKIVINIEFASVKSFSDGLALVENYTGKKYFINKKGNIAISLNTAYKTYKSFSEEMAVIEKHGKYGFIDKNGTIIIKPQYEYAYSFSEGLACVKKNGKYGFIDKNGKIVIKPQYEYAHSFSEGLAFVERSGNNANNGYIDRNGKMVIAINKNYCVEDFSEGFALIGITPPLR